MTIPLQSDKNEAKSQDSAKEDILCLFVANQEKDHLTNVFLSMENNFQKDVPSDVSPFRNTDIAGFTEPKISNKLNSILTDVLATIRSHIIISIIQILFSSQESAEQDLLTPILSMASLSGNVSK